MNEIKYTKYYEELVRIGNIKDFIKKYKHSEVLLLQFEIFIDEYIKLFLDTSRDRFKVINGESITIYENIVDAYEYFVSLIKHIK